MIPPANPPTQHSCLMIRVVYSAISILECRFELGGGGVLPFRG